jgi:hypothetical protein
MGDAVTCTGTPDTIAVGCLTVLIGERNGGGNGAGAGMGAGSAAPEAPASDETEEHYLDVQFVDRGGFPIRGVHYELTSPEDETEQGLLNGRIRRTGITPGDYRIELREIIRAEWSEDRAGVGEQVTMLAETVGIEAGTEAVLEIWQRDLNRPDERIHTVSVEVQADRIESEWAYEYGEEDGAREGERPEGYSSPTFYFKVRVAGLETRSGLLECRDFIEIELRDAEDNLVPDAEYVLYLSDGSVRSGTLDENGYHREEDIPPRNCHAEFPDLVNRIDQGQADNGDESHGTDGSG